MSQGIIHVTGNALPALISEVRKISKAKHVYDVNTYPVCVNIIHMFCLAVHA